MDGREDTERRSTTGKRCQKLIDLLKQFQQSDEFYPRIAFIPKPDSDKLRPIQCTNTLYTVHAKYILHRIQNDCQYVKGCIRICPGRSTHHARTQVRKALKEGNLILFIDFTKACNSIKHELVIQTFEKRIKVRTQEYDLESEDAGR